MHLRKFNCYRPASLIVALVVSLSALHWTSLSAEQKTSAGSSSAATVLLKPDDLKTIIPASVFFKGQSAPLQLRNSAGVHFADGAYVLTSLVDTSGYASSVQDRYQAYFITETTLRIGDTTLPPGAYGVGFLANHTFLVMDIGGHDLLTTASVHDEEIKHPTPLQITENAKGVYRLYAGRNYVNFTQSSAAQK
jgi:hypothetical protein